MTFFILLCGLFFTAAGAVFGRMDGGGVVTTNQWTERTLVMFAFVLACAPFAGLWSLLAYAGVLGIATGHGQYLPALMVRATSAEWFDFLVSPFFGRDPRTSDDFKYFRHSAWNKAPLVMVEKMRRDMIVYGHRRLYWRCVAGMFVTGTLTGIPAFLLSVYYGQYYGALFLLTGVVKSISYMIGWRFFKHTEPAEFMNGGGRNALCFLIILLGFLK